MPAASTKKKKSESRQTLPDGTSIKEYETEETHPDGTRTITTTCVKTYTKKKLLEDGLSHVYETVNSTTTTTRQCSKPVERTAPEAMEAAVQGAADAVGNFLDLFSTDGKACDNAACDNVNGDDVDDEEESKATATTRGTARQQRQQRRYSNARHANTNTNREDQRGTIDDDRDDRSLGVSTLGGWTMDSRLSNDSSPVGGGGIPVDTKWQRHQVNKIPVDAKYWRQREVHNSSPRPEQNKRRSGSSRRQRDREVYNSTPQSQQSQQSRQQQHQQQQQQQRSTPTAFFQKTHPSSAGSGGNQYHHNDVVNNYDNNYDGNSINTGGGQSFLLYETDRCEELPTFHKVAAASSTNSSSNSSSRNQNNDRGRRSNGNIHRRSAVVRSMTPTQRTYSNTSNAKDVNRNIKLGISSHGRELRNREERNRSTSRRNNRNKDDPNTLDPEVERAIDLIRQRSKSPVRNRRGRSSSKKKSPGLTIHSPGDNNDDDANTLDPEVVHAIDLIRQRSKSPIRNRVRAGRSSSRRSKQQQQQQQQTLQSPGLTVHAPTVTRQPSSPAAGQYQQQGIARQPTPTRQHQSNTARYHEQQPTPTRRQQSPSMMNQPMSQQSMFANNHQPQPLMMVTPNGNNTIQVPHPHDSSLHRVASRGYNPFASSSPRTPTGASGGAVDFDGLPLGNLANPIDWDDVSEMRDDIPSVAAVKSPAPAANAAASSRLDPLATRRSTKTKKKWGKGTTAANQSSNKLSSQSITTARPKKTTTHLIPRATSVKHNQALLPRDSVTTAISPPKIAIYKTNAIISSDKFIHFYSYLRNQWVQTTTVALQNTHGLSLALTETTAVIGVPYDRNSKGMLTGSAYIFERDNKTHTWYQVKKIVPKRVQEYATVGYSVDICDNVVVVGVPELNTSGRATGGGGSVYIYQRAAEQFKWMPMGHLTMGGDVVDPMLNLSHHAVGGLLVPPTTKFGTIVALRSNLLVVSNYQYNNNNGYSTSGEETSLFIYEYDPSLKNKWRLLQTDLLNTEGQRRNFGSHMALTSDGEGIFIGCHSDVNPTEILFYQRRNRADAYGNRAFQLAQIITVAERCDISGFKVDDDGHFVLGTLNSNRVYVYQQMHDLNTMESQGWRMVSKVMVDNIERFGSNVSMYGDNILVGSRDNVYSYSLEGWMTAKKKRSTKHQQISQSLSKSKTTRSKSTMSLMRMRSSPNRMRSSSPAGTRSSRGRFMSSLSPMRFRPSS